MTIKRDYASSQRNRQSDVPISHGHVGMKPVQARADDDPQNAEQQTYGEGQQSQQKRQQQHPQGDDIPARLAGWGHVVIVARRAKPLSAIEYISCRKPRPPLRVLRPRWSARLRSSQAPNGICYAVAGEVTVAASDLERMVAAVPDSAAAALHHKAYYFVPLTVNQGDETVIADRYDVALSDNAVCHRNLELGDSQCVFISTRLMDDKFSVAFEFYINVGHAVVERAGVSQAFAELVWKQVEANAKGETSLDAWESRKLATSHEPDAEKHKNEYFAATFSDAISIYLLSLYIDVDYHDLRERDYPLLAPAAMAERVRKVAELFPANPGFEFAIYYKRRS